LSISLATKGIMSFSLAAISSISAGPPPYKHQEEIIPSIIVKKVHDTTPSDKEKISITLLEEEEK